MATGSGAKSMAMAGNGMTGTLADKRKKTNACAAKISANNAPRSHRGATGRADSKLMVEILQLRDFSLDTIRGGRFSSRARSYRAPFIQQRIVAPARANTRDFRRWPRIQMSEKLLGGARRNRTDDLFNAIEEVLGFRGFPPIGLR
jgi:hypothetical protein